VCVVSRQRGPRERCLADATRPDDAEKCDHANLRGERG